MSDIVNIRIARKDRIALDSVLEQARWAQGVLASQGDEYANEKLADIKQIEQLLSDAHEGLQPPDLYWPVRYWVVTLEYWDQGDDGSTFTACVSGPGMTHKEALDRAVRQCYEGNNAPYPPEDGEELVAAESASIVEVTGFAEDENQP